jgi:two-component system response regulator YesN
MSVKQLAEEQFVDKWRSNTFFYLGDILVITQLKETEEISNEERIQRFQKIMNERYGKKES